MRLLFKSGFLFCTGKKEIEMPDEPEGSTTAVAEAAPEAKTEETTEPKGEIEAKEGPSELDELRAELEKTKLLLKSTQGVARGRLDTDAKVERYGREVARLRELMEASIKAQIAGEPEKVQADLDRIQQSAQQETIWTAAQERASEEWNRYIREAEDAGLDVQGGRNWQALEQAEEWQEANVMWNQGYAGGDPSKMNFRTMAAATNLAAELRRAAQIKAFNEAEVERRKASGELRTPALRAGAGGSPLAEQELVNRMGRGEFMTPAEMVNANAAMARGIYPKRAAS